MHGSYTDTKQKISQKPRNPEKSQFNRKDKEFRQRRKSHDVEYS